MCFGSRLFIVDGEHRHLVRGLWSLGQTENGAYKLRICRPEPLLEDGKILKFIISPHPDADNIEFKALVAWGYCEISDNHIETEVFLTSIT